MPIAYANDPACNRIFIDMSGCGEGFTKSEASQWDNLMLEICSHRCAVQLKSWVAISSPAS